MEFTGEVISVSDKSGVSKKDSSPFKAWECVVKEQSGEYPQSGVFEHFGDRVPMPSIGDIVSLKFSIAASEYNGRWYGKNRVFRMEVEKDENAPVGRVEDPLAGATTAAAMTAKAGEAGVPQVDSAAPGTADDLPF